MTGFEGLKWLRSGIAAAVLAGLAGPVMAQEQAAPLAPVEGVWRTQLLSEVTISACDSGFCGNLSHIVVPEGLLSGAEAEAAAAMSPDDFFDYRNEDPALRNRPMMGLQILSFQSGEKPLIYDGEIYNPEDGKTYSGYIEMIGPDKLRLNGCVLFNVICRGEEWTRVPPEELDARAEAEKSASAS